jgi:hypothetical protein
MWRKRIEAKLDQLIAQGAKEMSALSDLQAAVSGAVTEINAAITLLQGFQNGTVNADDPQVEAQVTALNTAVAALTAVVSPPPIPTPTPTPTPASATKAS